MKKQRLTDLERPQSTDRRVLVVGAGLSGAVVARELADLGYGVDVIELRDHVGGNCFDFIDENGIRVHRYGPHIFHTNNKRVFDWLSRYTEWIDYEHKVLAELPCGRRVPFPPNNTTLQSVDEADLIDIFYAPYTEKMWGRPIAEVNPRILSRVPVRQDGEDRYFPRDVYQKLPKAGYTSMITNILEHPNIRVSLSTGYERNLESQYQHIFNSMPIDEYFNYELGELPYRSIKFHSWTAPFASSSPVPVINLTTHEKFTRITEWVKFPGNEKASSNSTFTIEEPCDYSENNGARYYPVADIDGKNRALYDQYASLVPKNVTFIGRCGLYVYIDMDQAVSNSLAAARRYSQAERAAA